MKSSSAMCDPREEMALEQKPVGGQFLTMH